MFAAAPTYISSRSADVILSDVRPIKLSADALQAINVLLDELLYNIISVSHSLSTDNLKGALSKLIPTSLGKEALLEAEVELKAYWERTTRDEPADRAEAGFDRQWCFELLRLKCEAYSTMNDSDEDANAERRVNERMGKLTSSPAPKASLLAPAALYLTAILESICEHVLSNVGRVAARDSSRTIASVQDAFVALCEDDSMYGMFRTMKVYDQIEVLSRAQKPRRSKSFSRSNDKIAAPPRTSSPQLVSLRDSTSAGTRVRMSSESLRSNGTTVIASPEPRTSSEKARSIRKLMGSHNRTPSEKDSLAEITRAQEYGKSRGSAELEDDYDLLHEFDELMRSGATMKVSLTPDRLKSMEVYNKERTQRANRRGARDSSPSTDRPVVVIDTKAPPELMRGAASGGRPSLRHVDSIIEDEEETGNSKTPSTAFQSSAAARVRQGSLHSAAASSTPSPTRLRSISISTMPHPRHEDSLSRRTGISNKSPLPAFAHGPVAAPQRRTASNGDMSKGIAGPPQRKRRTAPNRESIDLDDVMGGSDDEEEAAVVRSTPVPKIGSPQKNRQPYVSQSAKELIAFLEEGPPDEPQFPHSSSANASVISFESSKTKTGRFSRMMSKLAIGSTEKLNVRIMDEPPKTPRSLGRKPSRNNLPPPPAYLQQSLNSKRSMPNVVVSTPPRPSSFSPPPSTPHSASALQTTYPMQPSPQPSPMSQSRVLSPVKVTPPPTASSSQTTSVEDLGFPTSPSRRSTLRKAVPAFDDKTEAPVPPAETLPPRNASYTWQTNGRSETDGVTAADHDDKDVSSPRKAASRVTIRHSNGVATKPENIFTSAATPLTLPQRSSRSRSPSAKGGDLATSTHTPTGSRSATSPGAPVGPAISATDVDDLRRLLSVATTADECRLLVDMFFARNGFPYRVPSPVAAPDTPPLSPEFSLTQLEQLNNDLECTLVELFLEGCEGERPKGVEADRHPDTTLAEEVMAPAEAPAQSLTEKTQTQPIVTPAQMVAV